MPNFVDHCVNCADAEQRGREQERAAVVAWLRGQYEVQDYARAIEAGEHLGGSDAG